MLKEEQAAREIPQDVLINGEKVYATKLYSVIADFFSLCQEMEENMYIMPFFHRSIIGIKRTSEVFDKIKKVEKTDIHYRVMKRMYKYAYYEQIINHEIPVSHEIFSFMETDSTSLWISTIEDDRMGFLIAPTQEKLEQAKAMAKKFFFPDLSIKKFKKNQQIPITKVNIAIPEHMEWIEKYAGRVYASKTNGLGAVASKTVKKGKKKVEESYISIGIGDFTKAGQSLANEHYMLVQEMTEDGKIYVDSEERLKEYGISTS
ncbi:MAG: hypothetical protein EOM40_09950 [Clostridia bacterium]|nr:hypothetical protein [Clostridia bacterium]NCC44063.1 hypothetical protein [Clostridia bacterium]